MTDSHLSPSETLKEMREEVEFQKRLTKRFFGGRKSERPKALQDMEYLTDQMLWRVKLLKKLKSGSPEEGDDEAKEACLALVRTDSEKFWDLSKTLIQVKGATSSDFSVSFGSLNDLVTDYRVKLKEHPLLVGVATFIVSVWAVNFLSGIFCGS